ncbi:hypothetical protein Ade02nite_19400 [Paractinoplanes deccanensis]|uniref:Helix-turn-helix domain-containing protein n=1 Tax=Paractinoplanes deccanensis TaxID=113561 RepID=A0ABQ3XZX4_9ACTN|nr:hypothetical protein [Actinoplanes deccanensis]GID73299.1 hypothetical protein Ade02nite_19400 [Actinoplanes deccanensis]
MPRRWDIEKAVLASKMPSPARLIVLVLAIKSDNETAVVPPEHTPALSTLAAMTGIARGSLAEWLHALDVAGWVQRDRHAGKGSKTRRTGYALAVGSGDVVLRDRSLRIPRPKKSETTSDLQSEGDVKVREADASNEPESPRGGQLKVREADASDGGKSPRGGHSTVREADSNSPRGGHTLTTPPPTGEGQIKNHQPARGAEGDQTPEAAAHSPSVRSWEADNRQPRTEGPRVPRQPSLFDVRRSEIEKLPEATRIIGTWLQANGYPHVSADDCRAVHQAIRNRHADVKDMLGYLRRIASAGGFQQYYQPIIEARADEISKQIRQLTDGQPDCGHGFLGGNLPHPTTRLALCPLCREGAPPTVKRGAETTHPDVRDALTAYRTAYRKTFGAAPLLSLLMAITGEAETLRRHGVIGATLTDVATRAGHDGAQLLETATRLKGVPA